jgi:hypothetical protein
MSETLTEIQAPASASVNPIFAPVRYIYGFQATSSAWADDSGFYQITVGGTIAGQAAIGDPVYIAWTSGTKPNWAIITDKTSTQITVNIAWDAAAHVATIVRIARPIQFTLKAGYQSGAGASVKPWKTVAVFKVRPDLQGRHSFDISGFLQTYNKVQYPNAGQNFDLTMNFRVEWSTSNSTTAQAIYTALTYANANSLNPVGKFGFVDKNGLAKTTQRLSIHDPSGVRLLNVNGADAVQNLDPGTLTLTVFGGQAVDLTYISQVGIMDENNVGGLGSLPDWLSGKFSGSGNQIFEGVEGTAPSVEGTFDFSITYDDGDNPPETWALSVVVIAVDEVITVCSDNDVTWLNIGGGYSSWYFDTEIIQGRTQGQTTDFIDTQNQVKKQQIERVYETVRFSSGLLSKVQIDYLAGLRNSIQAYYKSKAIYIEPQTFETYRVKQFNEFQWQFTFIARIAKELPIQTQ